MAKTFTTLTIDTDTRDLLRNLAGDMPVATYLRTLTGSDKGPEINIDQRLTAIESMLRQLVPEKEKDIRGLSTSCTVEDVRKELLAKIESKFASYEPENPDNDSYFTILESDWQSLNYIQEDTQ